MKESAYSIGDPSLIPGPEDPLEEGMATHSSTLAGKPHEQRSREGYSPWGHKESYTTDGLTHFTFKNTCIGSKLQLWEVDIL